MDQNSIFGPQLGNHGWECENTVFHLRWVECTDAETCRAKGPTVFIEKHWYCVSGPTQLIPVLLKPCCTVSPTLRCIPPCSLSVTSHGPKPMYCSHVLGHGWCLLPGFALYINVSYSMFSFESGCVCSTLCLWDSSTLLCVAVVDFHHSIVFNFFRMNIPQCIYSFYSGCFQFWAVAKSAACTCLLMNICMCAFLLVVLRSRITGLWNTVIVY